MNDDSRSDRSNLTFDGQTKKKSKRLLKLEKKLIGKAVLETELIRGGKRTSVTGFKERQTVTGVFSTLIYDLSTETLGNLKENDQQTIRDQLDSGFESVDTIRFIKTNKLYYDRVLMLFFKFFTANKARLQSAFSDSHQSESMTQELLAYLT